MTAYLLTDHLLNFIAPAAFVAVVLMLLAQVFGRLFKRKRAAAQSWIVQAAIIFVVNVCILVAGLALLGVDDKMVSYATMVVGAALCHWVLGRGWKN
jgi:SNF family Na+-dependent transporter